MYLLIKSNPLELLERLTGIREQLANGNLHPINSNQLRVEERLLKARLRQVAPELFPVVDSEDDEPVTAFHKEILNQLS